jgi:hypothetical protein
MATNAPPSEPYIFPAPAREYEFGPAENAVFSALARQMRFVGTAQAVVGVFLLLLAVTQVWMGGPPAVVSAVAMAVSAALLVVTGAWLRNASEPIARIVSTEGNDIRNLMDAMVALARMFSLQRVYLIAVFVALALGIVGVTVVLVRFFPVAFATG